MMSLRLTLPTFRLGTWQAQGHLRNREKPCSSTFLLGSITGKAGRDAIALTKRLAAGEAELTLVHVCKLGAGMGPAMRPMLDPDLDRARQLLERRREETSLG